MEQSDLMLNDVQTVDVLVPAMDESGPDLEALRRRYRESLKPVGPVEEALVEEISRLEWRLRRACRIEAGYLDYVCSVLAEESRNTRPAPPDDRRHRARLAGRAVARGFRRSSTLGKLARYEDSLTARFHQALKTLAELRRRPLTSPAEDDPSANVVPPQQIEPTGPFLPSSVPFVNPRLP